MVWRDDPDEFSALAMPEASSGPSVDSTMVEPDHWSAPRAADICAQREARDRLARDMRSPAGRAAQVAYAADMEASAEASRRWVAAHAAAGCTGCQALRAQSLCGKENSEG